MKIKSCPEDFVVEEFLTLPNLSPRGDYVIYRLKKRGLSTYDVLDRLIYGYRIPDRDIGIAGLKDKYALTSQYMSIRGRNAKEIREKNFMLTPLGRAESPIGPHLLEKNWFRITLRSLEKTRISRIVDNLYEVLRYGFPNYFGEQRFGSIRHGGEFLAKRLILGDFEGALKLYLSKWSSRERLTIRGFKRFVSRHWGDWEECLRVAPRSDERFILSYLKDRPRDFLRAVNLINRRMLFLYIAAYQSYLWNEVASEFIRANLDEDGLIGFHYGAGQMVFYRTLTEELFEEFVRTEIPLLDHRVEFPTGRIGEIVERVIKREGITIEDFRLDRVKNAFFKSALRGLIVFPEGLEISEPEPDEIYRDRFKLTLSFFLPPGSYASVLLRRIGIEGKK